MKRFSTLFWLVVLVFGAVVFSSAISSKAFASHYDLVSMEYPDLDKAAVLLKMGIATTEGLHKATATSNGRAKLARKLGVNRAETLKWHNLCDLLRVSGIGPKVARLFTAMGIEHLGMLARQEPGSLTKKIAVANQVYRILGKLPDEELSAHWIGQAKQLTSKRAGKKNRKR